MYCFDSQPALVPFRHSKLTELFQSFFVGDGKAVRSLPLPLYRQILKICCLLQVMIVNVNPYDTGFDENSHVMKFSAVAKGVMTVKSKIPVRVASPVLPCTPVKKEVRIVRLSLVDGGEEEDVVYEGMSLLVSIVLFQCTDLRCAVIKKKMLSLSVTKKSRRTCS